MMTMQASDRGACEGGTSPIPADPGWVGILDKDACPGVGNCDEVSSTSLLTPKWTCWDAGGDPTRFISKQGAIPV